MRKLLSILAVLTLCAGANAQSYELQDLKGIWYTTGAYKPNEDGGEVFVKVNEPFGFALTNYMLEQGVYISVFATNDIQVKMPYKLNGNNIVIYEPSDGKLNFFARLEIVRIVPKIKMIAIMTMRGSDAVKFEFRYSAPDE